MNSTFDREYFYEYMGKTFSRSAKIIRILAILGMAVFGGGLIAILATGGDLNSDKMVALVICLIFLAGSIWAFLYSRRLSHPEHNFILQDIRTGGDQIVWFYNSNVTVNGIPTYAVAFMNRSGKKRKIPAGSPERQEEILYGLNQLFPNAVIGYSPETAKEMKRLYRA